MKRRNIGMMKIMRFLYGIAVLSAPCIPATPGVSNAEIYDIQLQNDGKLLAAVKGSTLEIWGLTNRSLINKLNGLTDAIRAYCLSLL